MAGIIRAGPCRTLPSVEQQSNADKQHLLSHTVPVIVGAAALTAHNAVKLVFTKCVCRRTHINKGKEMRGEKEEEGAYHPASQ